MTQSSAVASEQAGIWKSSNYFQRNEALSRENQMCSTSACLSLNTVQSLWRCGVFMVMLHGLFNNASVKKTECPHWWFIIIIVRIFSSKTGIEVIIGSCLSTIPCSQNPLQLHSSLHANIFTCSCLKFLHPVQLMVIFPFCVESRHKGIG